MSMHFNVSIDIELLCFRVQKEYPLCWSVYKKGTTYDQFQALNIQIIPLSKLLLYDTANMVCHPLF